MLRQAALLLVLSGLAGLLTAWLHPFAPTYDPSPRSPLARSWAEVEALAAPVVFVDARTAAEYAAGHLPEALHVSEDDWDAGLESLMLQWEPAQVLIVYCEADSCHASEAVAQRLRHEFAALGYDQIYYLEDDWRVRPQGGAQ